MHRELKARYWRILDDASSVAAARAGLQALAADLKAAGWQLERVLCDNGNEYRGERFHQTIERLGAGITHIHAGRPQTNGHVEALHKTILDECWRPAFARYLYLRFEGLRREPRSTSTTTTTTAPTTAASPAAASPPTSSTVLGRWKRNGPHQSAHLGVGPGLTIFDR